MSWSKLGVAGSWLAEMSGGFSGWAYRTMKGLRALGRMVGDDHSTVCISLHHMEEDLTVSFLGNPLLCFLEKLLPPVYIQQIACAFVKTTV